MFLPRHKQVVRARLAAAAAKDGDLDAAEQWLAPCAPRSEDIESDSAYRSARAYIDTAKRNYRAVPYLRRHGLSAQGEVVGIEGTVKHPDAPPYQASFRQLMPTQLSAQIQPGVEIPLRVHPQKSPTRSCSSSFDHTFGHSLNARVRVRRPRAHSLLASRRTENPPRYA